MKLAEHNGIQTVWVPGHMRIDGNETAHQLARVDSPYPLTGPSYICKGCQGSDHGLNKLQTPRVLAVPLWIKAS